MANIDLEQTIEDSINDSIAPTEPADATADTETVDSSTETTEEVAEVEASADQAPTPGQATLDTEEVVDEFAKRHGITGTSVTGRENRIPYSRVKKITERAEKEAAAKVRKELEGTLNPKITEYEAKVKDYEGRLQRVAEFESIIENDPKQFLGMLAQIPAYKEFFDYLKTLAPPGTAAGTVPVAPEQQAGYLDPATMPQPDETLADGSKVYSLAGLAKRDEWLAKQVEERAVRNAEERITKRYAPIEQQWQAEQERAKALPIIQKQIADARQWPHFTEHEAAIIEILKADPAVSLDGAYRQVLQSKVLPGLQTSRDDMRKSILEELKKKPISTAVGVTPTKAVQVPGAPRSLEDIITEAAQTLK